ncbi:hypothetical protein EFA69_10860 [Rufibacter immobilis]|uniref:Uncharacterized protein n=1 Tax=Rufibacter immobilis TaxID=1348778 RepID=A0A3M9MWU3_9BACT|nr:hypothetical protein EFA69_10860 [Rufibacter immobilis]
MLTFAYMCKRFFLRADVYNVEGGAPGDDVLGLFQEKEPLNAIRLPVKQKRGPFCTVPAFAVMDFLRTVSAPVR